MTRRENLRDQYEDALFALLMDDLAWQEGERLLELNERLKNDPDADVPEEVMARCRKVINREFTKKTALKAGRVSWNVFKRAAVAACMTVLLFSVAFAASETVRINTLNLVIEVFDRYTDYRFVESPIDEDAPGFSGFEVGWLPENFVLTEHDQNQYDVWETYEGDNGKYLRIDLESFSDSGVISIDTEDAFIEDITINGHSVTLITKDSFRATMMFPESRQMLFALFYPEDILSESEKGEFLKILESVTLY